jgi:hypothetical protein
VESFLLSKTCFHFDAVVVVEKCKQSDQYITRALEGSREKCAVLDNRPESHMICIDRCLVIN